MTRRLDRYFFKEAIVPLLFGLLIYSSLAVVSVTLPRLQWIVGTPLGNLGIWLLLQFPAALVQTLPIALVLSVLLAFGRLATNNELQAVQAGGVSLARSTRIFILLGIILAGAALLINEWVLPKTNARVGSLYWELTSGKGNSGLWRLAAKNIPLDGYTLFFNKADRKTDELLSVRVEAWDTEQKQLTVLFAERAKFTEEGLLLLNYQVDSLNLEALNQDYQTAEELLPKLVLRHSLAPSPEHSLLLKTSDSFDDLVTRFSEGGFEDSRSIREVYQDANDPTLSDDERKKAAVLFHRKLAEPMANLSLLLIAVPLSLLYAGSRSIAFGLSLVVTLAWYLLFTLGQLFAQAGSIPIWLGVWAANIVLVAIGLYLLVVPARLR
jgi:lipopolysaccharide export system permease protein